jgi:hypothetical protein
MTNINPPMLPLTSFRPLDPEVDWAFFDPEFGVPPSIRTQVQPLTDEGSAQLWNKHVSAEPHERHPMLLPGTHWLKPTQQGPSWEAAFNSDDNQTDVRAFLQGVFNLGVDELIYFMAMRERSYSVPFGVFLSCWRCFLVQDDEGAFLFHAPSGAFASFGPKGSLSFGHRSAHVPDSNLKRTLTP